MKRGGAGEVNIVMPKKVSYIIDTLYEKGYEAFAVGGCIRDSLLGKVPKDWDITTNALPLEIKEIFPRTIDTGIEHGTVTVMIDKEGFEVTTYRIDGEYEDARHPKSVEFTSNLKLDLMRRDFTINAMAYNDVAGLVDEFDGEMDLQKGIIRCVGDALTRFDEDALRILRAIRFSARFGFDIHEDTIAAIKAKSPLLTKISAERIKAELDKTLLSNHPKQLILAAENGVFDNILCRIGNILKGANNVKIIERIERLHRIASRDGFDEKQILAMCWTSLIYDYSANEAKEHYKELKSDNYLLRLSTALISNKEKALNPVDYDIRKLASEVGADIMPCLLAIRECMAEDDFALEVVRDCSKIYREEVEKNHCMHLSEMAVTGKELIAAGIKQGKHMGDLLLYLLENVLLNPLDNNKEHLINIALEYEKKNVH